MPINNYCIRPAPAQWHFATDMMNLLVLADVEVLKALA
jgi:hypothetical protein